VGYRVQISFDGGAIAALRKASARLDQVIPPIVKNAANILHHEAVQNLSGVPFTSKTGTHTINKRTGRGAASVQIQYPYGSPFKARVFADYRVRYANNPEEWNILAILEYGRGEVKPKYTPMMRAGMSNKARLTIPVGGYQLVNGRSGFRGISGRYAFVKALPPMAGKHWLESATKTAQPKINEMVRDELNAMLGSLG
jgi:hypothetical protein